MEGLEGRLGVLVRNLMEGLEGRLGVLVRNLMTMKMVYWVNLSESSGAGSPGLSSINKWPLNGYCLPPTTDEVYVFARVRLSVCVQDYS